MAEQPAQQQPPADPQQRAAAIAAALAAAGGGAAGVAALATGPVLAARGLAALTRLWLRWRYRRETVRWGLRVVTRIIPTSRPPTPGPASTANARAERAFAAWFLERSTSRVQAAYDAGAEPGRPEEAEERFLEQHLDAQQRRRQAAERVDAEAAKPGHVVDGTPDLPRPIRIEGAEGPRIHGPRVILLWRAHPDDRVTPECRAADGCWFYADTPPIIGYPGMPHGGTCRCWPANAGTLAEVARSRHVNEAVRAMIGADHPAHPDSEKRTA